MDPETTTAATALKGMRDEILADSSLFADRLRRPPAADMAGYADVFVAAGGGAAGTSINHVYGLEFIFEGYLLHYRQSRLLAPGEDDFHLLAGDYMYARGLNHTAAIGDLFHIRALASLVEFCSFVHCERMDTRLALNAWAAVSICMADRSSGAGGSDPGCQPAFERFTAAAWGASIASDGLDSLLAGMLASRDEHERGEIEAILERIFAAKWQ